MKLRDFDLVISLGDNCATALALRDLQLHKETFPFDWVRSTTEIIYHSLLDDFERYITFGKNAEDFHLHDMYKLSYPNFPPSHVNFYGQHFTHYLNTAPDELRETLSRRAGRLKKHLESDKKILFVRSTESYLYDIKSRGKADLYWDCLLKIENYLIKNHPTLDFEILDIEVNTERNSTKRIRHLNLNFPHKVFDTHVNAEQAGLYGLYRNEIYQTLKSLL